MVRTVNADIPRTVDDRGRVWFAGAAAAELLLRGYDITELLFHPTPDITVYNEQCDYFDKTRYRIEPPTDAADDAKQRLATWWIAEPFRDLDVRATLLLRCTTDRERDRVNMEMDLFAVRDLLPVLRLMFMLVEHWRKNGIVWGVGRGSSVSSYVLFMIGIHKINSLDYNLDIEEFLR